jgi:predicted RNase H-like nuclease (RuvC/YqgF family)
MDFAQENQHQEEVANLKYYILNKKLMEYEDKITNRKFSNKYFKHDVENLKKNTKSLHEKLAETEESKAHIGAQNKKIQEMEMS